ncbi:UNVERIFIED_CONTAM: hypothetical protein PYX00_008489 [Menopon gallinae]|uniref:MYCBP-associated protein n=1 Tax=Menopon gallinae TaxID=328185 RepID=A0AAW2HNM4_9NEOP
MEIRKRQNVIFSDRLKRDKCDLVMNRNENHRKKLEEKELLMQAQIPDEDRWRGDPKFWKAPAKLPRKGMKNKYYARKMLMEEGILPKFESISVPDEVKMEKDVFCRESESRVDLWERSVYRRQQRVKFAKKIERLSPCKPEAENLIVIGKKILPPLLEESSENRDLPSIIITRAEEEEEVIDSDVVLNINGVELKLNEFGEVCSSNENAAWFVIFDACSIGRITEQSLPIENKGTVAIRYEWHHYIADCPEIPWRKVNFLERPFFFNKNPGVFLPGQKCDMKFYHYSNHPGFHTETWCLNLWPNLLGGGKSAKVTLTAVVENVFSTRDYKKVDQYLSFCARDSIIRDILNDVIDRVGRYVPRTLEYASFFTEEELFEFQNPSHYYRYSIVEQLKSMFEEIPFFRPRTWDFNLFTLEDLIRSYVDYEQQREMLCKLMNLTRALLRPERLNYKFDKKFKMVYNALCSVIDAMEINIVAIKDMYLKLEEQEFRGIDADVIPIPSDSASHYSVITSILTDDTISRDTLIADFRIGYKNMAAYRHNLYTTVTEFQ